MLKRRVIPVLFLRDGLMVRSEDFSTYSVFGHPVSLVGRLNDWDVDEVIILDISDEPNSFGINRDDHKLKGAKNLFEFAENVAATCSMPLAMGGHIRTLDDIRSRIMHGADKVSLDSALYETPELAARAARIFGAQAIVGCIDYRETEDGPIAFRNRAKDSTGDTAIAMARRAEDLGCGEILLHTVSRDGKARGYDTETIQAVVEAVEIPVIACGGAGHNSHFNTCLEETDVSAVAAGNIFQFTESAYPRAKQYLRARRQDLR